MTDQTQQAISRFLAMMAAGAIGATLSYMVAFGAVDARIKSLEDKTQSMPPVDYRTLQDERIDSLRERLNKHERYEHRS